MIYYLIIDPSIREYLLLVIIFFGFKLRVYYYLLSTSKNNLLKSEHSFYT